MRILLFNEFSSITGGVDIVVQSQLNALRKQGADVRLFSCFNQNKKNILISSLSKSLSKNFQKVLDEFKPDIIHFHNVYPYTGSSIWNNANSGSARIILHLHNFYPLCLNSFQYLNQNCSECSSRNSWIPGIMRRCKDNSILKSLYMSYRIRPAAWIHSLNKVSKLITVSNYLQYEYAKAGVPVSKMTTLFNPLPQSEFTIKGRKHYVLFLGIIRREKGIYDFCRAAADNAHIKFIAAGTGPELCRIKKNFNNTRNLSFAGYVSGSVKSRLIMNAAFLVIPSHCPEAFCMTAAEAFSFGVPVLTTGAGNLKYLVEDKVTGRICTSLNLSASVKLFWNELQMKNDYYYNCLAAAKKYSPEQHAAELLKIYKGVLKD